MKFIPTLLLFSMSLTSCTSGPIAIKTGDIKTNNSVVLGNDKAANKIINKMFQDMKVTLDVEKDENTDTSDADDNEENND
jgi:hypothetical protein